MAPATKRATQRGAGKQEEEQAAPHAKCQKTGAASDSAAVPVAGVAVERPGAGADPASEAASPAIGGTSPGQPNGSVMELAQCPQLPTRSDGADTWAKYYSQLSHFVRSRLPAELAKNCDMDIRQFGELHQCPCTDIKRNTKPAIGDMTTYKETWNVHNCITSMETTKKYEAAGSIFGLDLTHEAMATQQYGVSNLG